MKKALIAMACVVGAIAVGLLVFMGLSISGVLPQGGFRLSVAQPELANRQSFSAGQYDDITVSYSLENITLLPSPTGEVVLEEYFSKWDEDMLAKIDSSGSTLNIQAGRRSLGWGFIMWRAQVKLYLPAGWQGSLTVECSSGGLHSEMDLALESLQATSTSGSIHLQTVAATGDIQLKSSSGSLNSDKLSAVGEVRASATSGSLRLGDVEAGTAFYASASSGSVRVDSAAAPSVEASATSGSIRFDRLDGAFKLDNSSGGIRVEDGDAHGSASCSSGSLDITLARLIGDLTMKTSSGGCRLALPEDSAFHFSAQTSSGGIKTPDNGALSFNERGNQASGSFGASADHQVHMEASSGSVRLQWH